MGKGQADSAGFNRVAYGGAGAMRLEIIYVIGADVGLLVDAGHQFGLGGGVGNGQAGFMAIGIDRAACDDGQNGVAIG